MTTDLTQPDLRPQRDALADHVDVLDKVKALTLLPGDAFATTDLVAGYYEVDADVIRQIVVRNRDEIDADGYRVVSRSVFESDIASLSKLDPRARTISIFPRRAILRVGMLLRDSRIAKAVRDCLLDAERAERRPVDVSTIDRSMLARWVIEAEDRAKAAEAHVALLEPPARAWASLADAAGDYSLRDAAQILSRDHGVETGQNRLMDTLRDWGWVDRKDIPYQRVVDLGYVRARPRTYEQTRTNVRVLAKPQIRVTAKGLEKILARLTEAS